jgi:hypothetical protein
MEEALEERVPIEERAPIEERVPIEERAPNSSPPQNETINNTVPSFSSDVPLEREVETTMTARHMQVVLISDLTSRETCMISPLSFQDPRDSLMNGSCQWVERPVLPSTPPESRFIGDLETPDIPFAPKIEVREDLITEDLVICNHLQPSAGTLICFMIS